MQSRGSTKSTDKACVAVSMNLNVIILLSSANKGIASIKLHCPMVSTGVRATVTTENIFNLNLNKSSYPNNWIDRWPVTPKM